VKARAVNQIGEGEYSAESTASEGLIVTAPADPSNAPYRDESACTETEITVVVPLMTTQAETGGMAVLSYNIEADTGSGFAELIGETSDSTVT
jgi:hypothetical protein